MAAWENQKPVTQPNPADNPSGSPATILELHQVSMQFGNHLVLDSLELEIGRGKTVCIIGESGCGKTVLLKLLIGLLRPSRGRVVFDGKILVDLPEKDLVHQRLRFGYLFQGAALFDSLNVLENVAFGLRTGQWTEVQIKEKVCQRLMEVGLPASLLDKKPAELSGGMKKRVALARALAIDPEVMLYDEPTTGLDPIMTDVINELILQTRRHRPVTSVVVTHEMRTVKKVADRVVMLDPLSRLLPGENQIIFDGTPEELYQSSDPRVQMFIDGNAGERLRDINRIDAV